MTRHVTEGWRMTMPVVRIERLARERATAKALDEKLEHEAFAGRAADFARRVQGGQPWREAARDAGLRLRAANDILRDPARLAELARPRAPRVVDVVEQSERAAVAESPVTSVRVADLALADDVRSRVVSSGLPPETIEASTVYAALPWPRPLFDADRPQGFVSPTGPGFWAETPYRHWHGVREPERPAPRRGARGVKSRF